MTIAIFLYAYYVFVLFFLIFSFFVIYHLFAFGTHTFENVLLLFVFVSVAVLILFSTYYFAQQIDWTTPIFSGGGASGINLIR